MITAAATATPTLRLVVEPAGYHVGAPVEVTFLLGNAAAAPLWLNRRLAIDSPQAPRFARELWLDFRGPDGRNVEFVTPAAPRDAARPAPAMAADYSLLAPGDELRLVIDLHKHYALRTPGRYLLRANYADGHPHPPPPPPGAVPLVAHLQSPKLTLLLLP